MGVLGRNNISVNIYTRPSKDLTKSTKLVILFLAATLSLKFRGGLSSNGTRASDSKKRAIWRFGEKFGANSEFAENGEGEREETETSRWIMVKFGRASEHGGGS